MLDICIQTSYDQNVQLILKSYIPVVYGTTLSIGLSNILTLSVYSESYFTNTSSENTEGTITNGQSREIDGIVVESKQKRDFY
jgi:hypothetical protein